MSRVTNYYPVLVILACILAMILGREYPSHYFDEWNVMTYWNAAQIFLIGVLSLLISTKNKSWFWVITSLGSFYFGYDELYQQHESYSSTANFLRGFGFSDISVNGIYILSVGDMIQGFYIVFVTIFLWLNRRQLISHKEALNFFMLGAIFIIVSEVIDYSDIATVNSVLFSLSDYQKSVFLAVEEACKTVGFSLLLMGVLRRYQSSSKNG